LWVEPPGRSGAPDLAAVTQETTRWTVGPLDRFGEPRRIFLVLRPSGACRPGETLWARVSLEGDWLDPAERGGRTHGGILTDCDGPPLVFELLTVRARSQKG
jgi:hypothetical protein